MPKLEWLQPMAILGTLLYALIGVAIFWIAFIVIDKITPYKLWEEIVEHKNVPPSYPGFGPRKLDEAGRIHPAGKGAPVLRPRILLSKSAGHEKRAEFLGHGFCDQGQATPLPPLVLWRVHH